MSTNSKKFNQFYTKGTVAVECFNYTLALINRLPTKMLQVQYIEPSAGAGVFYDLLPSGYYNIKGRKINKRLGFDIDPRHTEVKKLDFLSDNITEELLPYNQRVVIGNPPFGKRAKLAIEFFNCASKVAPIIAFIVPLQFKKWGVQSKLNESYDLLESFDLGKNSFVFDSKDYDVNCCFQIWVNKSNNFNNLRVLKKPSIVHPDFKMWQYNNTKTAEKVFNYEFDFAVLRQGYGDYKTLVNTSEQCDRRKQWILFKAKNKTVLNRLKKINFEKLSKKNTTVPGFGKADVVEYYRSYYENTK